MTRTRIKALAVFALLVCITSVVLVIPSGAFAHAATATCYKDGCDNTDPIQTGCASPSLVTTDASHDITDKYGNRMGVLEVRLSHARPYGCNTVWVRITSHIGTANITVLIYNYPRKISSKNLPYTYTSVYTSAYTNQFGRDGKFEITGCLNNICTDVYYK